MLMTLGALYALVYYTKEKTWTTEVSSYLNVLINGNKLKGSVALNHYYFKPLPVICRTTRQIIVYTSTMQTMYSVIYSNLSIDVILNHLFAF